MIRGASADAAAGLEERMGTPSDGARLGQDLFAVAGLLRSEASLRRVVTDVSVPADARAGLVRDMLSEKVGGEALGIVESAVSQRWTATRDLADTLERLGVVAVVRSTGDDAGRLSDELFGFGQLVQENPGLRDALSDPSRSQADKRGLVGDLLAGKTLPATTALVEQALAGGHRTVGVAIHEYQKVAAEAQGRRIATVRVSRELSESDQQRLTDTLSRQYGREVHLNVLVDPDVVGGIRVEIGDDVIDGTVASRLDAARRKLAG